jgi:hypothetical protein
VTATPENVPISAEDAQFAVVRAVEQLLRTEQTDDTRSRADLARCRDDLRATIGTFVALLRRDGDPPEQAIVRVKEVLRTVAAPPLVRRRIMNDMVSWCIEEYYR